MTGEEANKVLKNLYDEMVNDFDALTDEEKEAFSMVNKILTTCDDAISRADVINLLSKYKLTESKIVDEINNLPSVSPVKSCFNCKYYSTNVGSYPCNECHKYSKWEE